MMTPGRALHHPVQGRLLFNASQATRNWGCPSGIDTIKTYRDICYRGTFLFTAPASQLP
jgi:hypothetical protein